MKISRVSFGMVFAFSMCLVGCKTTDHSDASRPRKQYTIEELMDNVSIFGASFSHDESSLLVTSDETGIVNAFRIDRATGVRTPLTKSEKESTYAISYFPKDERTLVTHDQGGNEENHIYLIDRDGKERDLTPGSGLKAQFSGWSRDDRAFYVQTNERDKKSLIFIE